MTDSADVFEQLFDVVLLALLEDVEPVVFEPLVLPQVPVVHVASYAAQAPI